MQQDDNQKRKRFSFWKTVQSTLAAAVGVQSHRRHQEDFTSSSALPYIVSGVIFTVMFVGILLIIVKAVLA